MLIVQTVYCRVYLFQFIIETRMSVDNVDVFKGGHIVMCFVLFWQSDQFEKVFLD